MSSGMLSHDVVTLLGGVEVCMKLSQLVGSDPTLSQGPENKQFTWEVIQEAQ